MMAWEAEDFKNYLNEEDITDDYEVGISGNVKRMTKKVLAGQMGYETSGSEIEKSDEESFSAVSLVNSEDLKPFKVMELFSPPRVTAAIQERKLRTLCATDPMAFDLVNGWDFFNAADRKRFWTVLEEEEPDLVLMTPECKAFCSMMNVNWERMDPAERKKLQFKAMAMAMFQFCIQVAERQLRRAKFFLIEQPDGASSWNTHAASWLSKQLGVLHISFDQYMAGLQVHPDGPSKKRTAFMLNHVGIAQEMASTQCDGSHEHVVLEHGLPAKAQEWPVVLVNKILEGIVDMQVWMGVAEEPLEEEEEEEAEEREKNPQEEEKPLSTEQKEMVKRIHVNMGHLPTDRMLVMLKAAKAQDKVIRYVRDEMKCQECMRQRREIKRRRAAYPRTFEFNKIVGCDIFYVKMNGKKLPFLNVVDHGSNWQACCLVKPSEGGEPSNGVPTAADTWRAFLSMWIRPHGDPEVVITDGGMEFKARFERGLEQHSVLQAVTDIQSPWQNGRVERHGQWVKDRLELELSSGSSLVENYLDLEELAIEVVNCKNIWFSRGGYSPAQIVYGRNPRLPAELLSDANQNTPGWADILCDPSEMDTPAFEFKRASQIRDRAKQLAMEHSSREKLRDAAKPPLHRHRTWNPGQWVLVCRIAVGGERSRWVGPGLVILQNGHTVYVAMRSRLWKRNSDQLRPATPTEELGMQVLSSEQYRDLLQQMQSQRTGAVDVAREGAPGEDAWRTPMRNPEERETIRSIVPEEAQRARGEERESGTRDGPAAGGTGSGHLLRGLGEQGAGHMNNQQGTARESRRASLETVSEPYSEPQGEAASIRSEDSDTKRRRLDELQPIAEGNEAEAVSAEANAEAAMSSAAASSSVQIPEQASVSQRVQEIEERPHMRRRSRSPVQVITRQLRLQERQPPPNSLSLVNWQLLGPNFNWDAQDTGQTAEQMKWKKAYKEDCVFYNNMINEAEEATAARGEVQETSNFFALGVAENDASGEVWAVEPARNGEITWKEMTSDAERSQGFPTGGLEGVGELGERVQGGQGLER